MENELVRVKLNLIRSQLNPHFMFNALNGIQSLINNHKLEEANNYLVKFARLTRKILNHDDFVTINDEVVLLTDYLQMEQLRFHFQFSVKVDPADLGDVKIPAMLIQPFVENSVRHGVSELRTNGLIKIDIKKDFDNLNISIADNGTGFDIANKENGQGSRLMDDRISLLNNIQNETFIEAHLKSDISGTVVSLTLQKWLK
jgi:LytS/YehU family sensor histidine kinase